MSEPLFRYIHHGREAMIERDYQAAHEALSRAVHLVEEQEGSNLLTDEQMAELYLGRGIALWYQEEALTYQDPDIFHQVLNDLEQAIDILPAQPRYHNLRGRLYLEATFDDYQPLAREEFEAALSHDAHDADALKNLGELLLRQQRFDAAIDHFSRSLDQQIDKETYLLRGKAYFQRIPPQFQAAAADFGKAQELLPGLEELYHWRAQCFQELGEWELAIQEYDRLIDLAPDQPGHYVDRGVLKLQQDEDAALADFDQALSIAPHALAYNNRAALLRQRGEHDHALADAQAALALDPKAGVAHATMAEIYADLGDRTAFYQQLALAMDTYYDDVVEVMSEAAFQPYVQEDEFQALLKQDRPH
jgi:tetratricopeptide (TPR) repeat protein